MARAKDLWFVYVLRCGDGTLYTGIARDVEARVAMHARGRGAKYTRGRGPFAIAATTRCDSHGEAARLEAAVKRLPRATKESWVASRAAEPRKKSAHHRRPATPAVGGRVGERGVQGARKSSPATLATKS